MRQGVSGDCEFGLLFERFSLGPRFEEFQNMADFGVCEIGHCWELPSLLEPQFAAQCCPMIALSAHTN